MNWELAVAIVSLIASALSGWVALSMRASRAELLLKVREMMAELNADIRRDINGSYMRANEVRAIIHGVETEIRSIAARMERR